MPKQTKRTGSTPSPNAASASLSFDKWLPTPAPSPASSSSSTRSRPTKKPKNTTTRSTTGHMPTSSPSINISAPATHSPSRSAPSTSAAPITDAQFANVISTMPFAVQRRIIEGLDCETLRRLHSTTNPDVAGAFRTFLHNIITNRCPPVVPNAPTKPRRR